MMILGQKYVLRGFEEAVVTGTSSNFGVGSLSHWRGREAAGVSCFLLLLPPPALSSEVLAASGRMVDGSHPIYWCPHASTLKGTRPLSPGETRS